VAKAKIKNESKGGRCYWRAEQEGFDSRCWPKKKERKKERKLRKERWQEEKEKVTKSKRRSKKKRNDTI